MPRGRTVVLLVATALALVFALAPRATHAGTSGVTIVNFAFQPGATSIHVGDSVTWTWSSKNGGTPHSTTSDSSSSVQWDSGTKTSGSFTQTFTSPGTFSYHCSVHSNMTGTITVLPNPAATATPTATTAPTPLPTAAVAPTSTPRGVNTPTPTPTATSSPTAVATGTSSVPTVTPTSTVAAAATDTPTVADSPTPTATAVPTTPVTTRALRLVVSGRLLRGHDATLKVTVTSQGKGVSHAVVTLDGRHSGITSLRRGTTDARGRATLRHLRPVRLGSVVIKATHSGYRAASTKLAVRG